MSCAPRAVPLQCGRMVTALRATIRLRPGPLPSLAALSPKIIEREAARSIRSGGLGRTGHGPSMPAPLVVQSGRCSRGRFVRGRVISKNPSVLREHLDGVPQPDRVRPGGSGRHHRTLESVRTDQLRTTIVGVWVFGPPKA